MVWQQRALVLGILGFFALTDIPKREEKRGGSLLERHGTGVLTCARYLPARVRIGQSPSDSLPRSLSAPSATMSQSPESGRGHSSPAGTVSPSPRGRAVGTARAAARPHTPVPRPGPAPRRAARMLRSGGGGAGAGRGAVAPRRGS